MMAAYFTPKRQFLQEPHHVISHRTALFIVTAVRKYSDPEYYNREVKHLKVKVGKA
jgi:hypothetical protein